jgi:hypothetical protein
MGVAQRMQAGALGQAEPPAEQRYRGRNRIGLQRRAVGIRKDQIQIPSVVGAKLLAELLLLLAVGLERRQHRRRQLDSSRLP